MADILTELFNQFYPKEQAQIRSAQAAADVTLTQGSAAVRDRAQAPTSIQDDGWILKPQDEARANAACILFNAYCMVLWGRTDLGSRESIGVLLAQLDTVCTGVLARYGQWEGRGAIGQLRATAEHQAWSAHAKKLEAAENAKEAQPSSEFDLRTRSKNVGVVPESPGKERWADSRAELQAETSLPSDERQTSKKRGRKSTFTQDRLEVAHQMKLAGKSNNEIAKTLYGANTSTPAQRRSVPTILKHHFGSKK